MIGLIVNDSLLFLNKVDRIDLEGKLDFTFPIKVIDNNTFSSFF